PDVKFTLVDSIAKKIRVVEEVVTGLGLENVEVVNSRVEQLDRQFDFVVSRAVAAMPTFVRWVRERIKKKSSHTIENGILYLKGGDLTDELTGFKKVRIIALKEHFEEEFFETKSVVYLSI
ncbi:MAG: RsmG family class I SAM-dependent methyltransferase, partial [Flavobacteriaceae bacterium]